MNWVVMSLLMFVSSVWMYLFVRKSSLQGYPVKYNFFAMFSVSFVVVTTLGLVTRQNFLLTLPQFGAIFLAAVIFSYIGNHASLKSIALAPNPGYSLVLSKSYVVLTTLVSVLIFHAEFSFLKGIAIALVIGFSAFIVFTEKKRKKDSHILWIPLAFVAFFCFSFLSLSSKYLFDQGVSPYVFLSYLLIIVLVLLFLEKGRSEILALTKKDPRTFLAVGIGSAFFNLSLFLAYTDAPNIGYVDAINSSSISAVTIASVVFFKDELTLKKFIGVIGVTVGLVLLLI